MLQKILHIPLTVPHAGETHLCLPLQFEGIRPIQEEQTMVPLQVRPKMDGILPQLQRKVSVRT